MVMNEQDIRAIEGLARCGIELDDLIQAFPSFAKEDVEKVYQDLNTESTENKSIIISRNCS